MREEKEENERQIALLEKRITKIKEEKDQELMLVSLQLEKQRRPSADFLPGSVIGSLDIGYQTLSVLQ